MALPSGYTPLEYIESTGSQYVDTGFKANNNTRLVMDVVSTNSEASAFFGGRDSGSVASFTVFQLSQKSVRTDFGSQNNLSVTVADTFSRITIDKNGASFAYGTVTTANKTATFQANCNLYLLCVNTAGTISYPFKGKLYACQIYDNGTLVRDYVPCTNISGTVGLYDMANGVFYGNAGTGTFIAGPVAIYTELEYIESTGTQYVDTGLVVNKTDSYEYILDALLTNGTFGGANGYLQFEGSISGGKRVNIRVSYDGSTHVTTVYVDGVVSSTTDWTSSYSGENVKIGILRMGNAGNVWYTSAPQIGKVYSCQIKKNGSLVRDYVPDQRLDGTVGLLDKVSNVFYPDAAGGNFIAGPVIEPPDPPEPPGPYEPPDYIARTQAYMATLREPFQKLCRLRFLQPDGSTAFSLDNNPKNRRSGAFIADGSIATNLQNGKRRTATVMLSNLDGSFDYNVNTVWFGTEIAIDEGLILPDGEEYYIQQGVFLIENPTESIRPGDRIATYNLVDKWANLDGTLFGNLESTYEVPSGTNIFQPINAILALDKGNGQPVDRVTPIYTEYYNSKSQALPDGSTAAITNAPYTLRVDSDNGTYADVILGLAGMVNAWIGYDQTGALRIDPSQDDILDTNKPVLWQFSMDRVTFLGADYTVKNTEVYNDYIVIGELLDDNSQPAGRATNMDPRSDTNVQTIGRKTFRMSAPGFATDQQCQDLAVWKLKRSSALQKAITISCSQIFHIEENSLVSIVRTDKPGSPVERHLVMGFTRPLVATGEMQINAVSVQDFVTATVTSWPE